MKICVITPLFTIAGVPLAQTRFARALANRGHEVDLVIGRVLAGQQRPMPPGVNVIELRRDHVRSMLLPLVKYLRANNPAVIFSAEDHLTAVVLLSAIIARSKAKISGSSRVTPFDTYSDKPFSKGWLLKQAMRLLMWRANVLTCVSQDMVAQYKMVFKKAPHVCVYNIVDDAHSRERITEPFDHDWVKSKSGPLLIAAGRLAPWKGFADLLNAMKLIPVERRARLIILGDGPLRAELNAQIESLGIQNIVRLEGYVENPLKYFAQADVFVLSSHVEGLPNVLVEAMMCGCTPVATDCPTGPREVLQDGEFGYLVTPRSPSALAAGIVCALDQPISKSRLAQAIRAFEEDAVINRHFEVLTVRELCER